MHPQDPRELSPQHQIEVLVPDFRGRDDRALEILKAAPPDVMNHNLETMPRLYKEARPGSDYAVQPEPAEEVQGPVPGRAHQERLMVGLGETDEEILQVMRDMRAHHIDMLTIGQYLAPSTSHLPVKRYVHPDTFKMFEAEAYEMGFRHAAVGAMVRDQQLPRRPAGDQNYPWHVLCDDRLRPAVPHGRAPAGTEGLQYGGTASTKP
jgi:lipoic acid synthetase